MKRHKNLIKKLAVTTALLVGMLPARGAITGQWDFDNGDLTATIGQEMSWLDGNTQAGARFGTTTALGVPDINGAQARIVKIPKTDPEIGGLMMSHGAAPNADGILVNRYTVIADVLIPTATSGRPRGFIQTDFFGDVEWLITSANSLGNKSSAHGNLAPNVWHRVALAVDLAATPPAADIFVNGAKAGTVNLSAGDARIIDSRWALDSFVYLFNDDDGETEEIYLNSLQFRDERMSDGLIAALGGPAASGILTGPPPNPFIASISPSPESARIPARSTVPPRPKIEVVIENGISKIVNDSIRLTLDNQVVAHTITTANGRTVVSFTPAELLAPLSVHSVAISYRDDATPPNNLGTTWQFAVTDYNPLPAALATPAGTANTRGFTVRTVQGPRAVATPNSPENMPNTVLRGIQQLNGTLRALDGTVYANEAHAGSNSDGSHNIDGIIDFEKDALATGNFQTDSPFPGVPGTGEHTDQFTTEILTYLDLPAGSHTFGFNVSVDRTDVADDDTYALFAGHNPRDFFSTLVGEFKRTASGFNDRQNDNVFTFVAPVAGIYPMRVVYVQGGRGASLEWYSVDPVSGEKIPINADDPRSIKAFRVSTAATSNKPFVAEVSPRPGTSGNNPAAPIEILIDDGQTQVNPASIRLRLDGALVTPSVTKSGRRTRIVFQPSPTRANATNEVELVYADNANPATSLTNKWQFTITVNTTGGDGSENVTGQWDFDQANLAATIGQALEYLDGPNGQTATKTRFGTTASFGIPDINGQPAGVMFVPGDLTRDIGYIMRHGIAPNGGGSRVNQYTLIMDLYLDTDSQAAASLIQINSLNNTDDGDLFWQGQLFGQGQGGYDGFTRFTNKRWHRVAFAVDLAANPPMITKYLNGVKHADWPQVGIDQDRRALKEFAILFGDGDQDERLPWYVNSIQIRKEKLSDAQLAALGGPSAAGIPQQIPPSRVKGQWDFESGNLAPTVGKALEYLDGANGQTAQKTRFGTTTSFGIPNINGEPANVMFVPGDLTRDIGYIMHHGIAPNGGGSRVNQYTLIMDLYLDTDSQAAASLLQVNSLNNTDDGDLFWQGQLFGQGQGGYDGFTRFTNKRWHRVAFAVDLAANPPMITKYLDGVKHADWVQVGLDQDRRALKEFAILFGDGDQDERLPWYVNSIQIIDHKLSDAQLAALGGPSAKGIPLSVQGSDVKGQWDFKHANLAPTVGKPLEYLDGAAGQTATKTRFGTTASFGIPDIGGKPANVMYVPGDLTRDIGYIMRHGIAPNGGGSRVNQYTLIMDLYLDTDSQAAASLLQVNSLNNTDDGDYFWQAQLFGQGQGGYAGATRFTNKEWHRVSFAVDLAANPPMITKYLDGVKHADWPQVGLDQDRRALKEFAILFGDGDQDERLPWYVNSVQIRDRKLSDAELEALGGPSADGIPVLLQAAASPVAPRLSISPAGANLVVSWPAGLTGFTLESSDNLAGGAWTPVTGVVNNSVTVTPGASKRFYRLKR